MANKPSSNDPSRAEQELARALGELSPEVLKQLSDLPPELLSRLGRLSPEAMTALCWLPLPFLSKLAPLSTSALEWLGRSGMKLSALEPELLIKLTKGKSLGKLQSVTGDAIALLTSLPPGVLSSLAKLPPELLRELPEALSGGAGETVDFVPSGLGSPNDGLPTSKVATLAELPAESLATLLELPSDQITTLAELPPGVIETVASIPPEMLTALASVPPDTIQTLAEMPIAESETLNEITPGMFAAMKVQSTQSARVTVLHSFFVKIGALGASGGSILGRLLTEARPLKEVIRPSTVSGADISDAVEDGLGTLPEIPPSITAETIPPQPAPTASSKSDDDSADWSEGLSAFETNAVKPSSKLRKKSATESADFSEAFDPEGVSADDDSYAGTMQAGDLSEDEDLSGDDASGDAGQTVQSVDLPLQGGTIDEVPQGAADDDASADDACGATMQSEDIDIAAVARPHDDDDSHGATVQSKDGSFATDGLSALDSKSDDDDSYGPTMQSESLSDDEDSSKTMVTDSSMVIGAGSRDDDSYGATMQSGASFATGADDESFAQTADSNSFEDEAQKTMASVWGTVAPKGRPGSTVKDKEPKSRGPKNTLVITTRKLGTKNVPEFNKEARLPEPKEPEYELLKVLGEGGMGIVFAANQCSIDREVAIKMLKAKTSKDKEQRAKFLTEAVVTGELDHPNIVPIYDVGASADDALFYSMKKVQGTPWLKVIKDKSTTENIEILMRSADAVAFAHARGVIHRDLKPENIMLGAFGEVLVMDWGLAYSTPTFRKHQSITESTSMGGTPAYMAPEMATGPINKVGPHSDVYLFGAMLFEIITGKPPHAGKNAMKCLMAAARNEIREPDPERSLKNDPTGELLAIAMKSMATDVKQRHQSVIEFQGALRDYQSHTESVTLAARASDDLKKAKVSNDYQDFARSVFGFEEAFAMWAHNTKAKEGVVTAKFAYAQSAQVKGDLDLGMSLLDVTIPEHKQLYAVLKKDVDDREAHKAAVARYKKAGMAAAALFFMVISGAAIWIDAARRDADAQRVIAVASEAEAKKQEAEAKKQEGIAVVNAIEAKKQEAEAKKQELIAIDNAIEAKQQTVIAKANAAEANKQTAIAKTNLEEATKQRTLAEASAIEAKKQEGLAKEQELLAVKSEKEAKKQEGLAKDNAAIALKNAEEAKKNAEEARKQEKLAKDNEVEATKQKLIAVANEKKAVESAAEAVRQQKIADEQRVIAEAKRKEAEVARGAAEYQGYIANIGLADAKIRENAFAAATQILGECPPRLRNWEWGRLMHLCTRSVGSFDNGAPVDSIAIAPGGKKFVTGGWNGEAVIWHSESGKALQRFKHEGLYVHAVSWSPDGKWIATGSNDPINGFVQLWNAATGERVARPFGRDQNAHSDAVLSVQFSKDSSQLLSGSYDNTARLWTVATGAQAKVFSGHTWWIWDAKFSPKGDKIVTASQDGTAIVWDAETAKAGPPFTGHEGAVYSVAFSADGFTIATGGYDKRVLLWKPEDVRPYDFRKLASNEGSVRQQPKFRPLDGHTGPVRSVEFSRDGRHIISGSQDNTVKLWSTESAQVVKSFRGHDGAVRVAAFAESDQVVLSASHDNRIKKWSIGQYEEIRVLQGVVLEGHLDAILAAGFSPDGKQIVTASRDHTARTWDSTTGQMLKVFSEGHSFLASNAVFFPNGKRFATAAVDNTVRIWDADSGTQFAMLEHTGRAAALAISADGKWLLTGSDDKSAKVWNTQTGALAFALTGHRNEVSAVAFSPNGLLAVSGDSRGRVSLWDLKTQKLLHELEGHARVRITGAVFIDDKRVLTACADNTVAQWNAETGKEISTLILKHPDAVNSLVVRPNTRQVITACSDQKVRIWDADTAKVVGTYDAKTTLNSVAVNAAGDWALAVDADNRKVQLWPLNDAEQITPTRSVEIKGPLWSAIFAPSRKGQTLLTLGGTDARLVNAETSTTQMTFSPHGVVASANFSPKGDRIVTGSWDFSARIWNAATGADELKLLGETGHTGFVNSSVFSPDAEGKWVLTASDDGTAKLWDAKTGQMVKTLEGHADRVRHAEFSADGKLIVTSSSDKTAWLWDVATSKPITKLQGHEWAVLFAQFSPDGSKIITASEDNSARIWDVKTGQQLHVLAGHTARVTAVAFAPTGNRAVTASQDGTVKLWDTNTEKEILTLDGHTREVTAVTFSPDGKYVLTGSQDGRAILWLAVGWEQPEVKKVATSAE